MSSLLPVFQDKLIPWSENNLDQRLVVVHPVMKKSSLPYGVELSRRKIPGRRETIRHRRYGNQRIYCARWTEAGLHELDVPKLICVTKGVTDYQAGEYIITCSEGHFILLPPLTPNTSGGRSHLEGEHRKSGSCELLQFVLFRDSIKCLPCTSRGDVHLEDDAASCLVRHHQAVHLFELFAEEAVSNQENSHALCRYLLPAFFVSLFREIKAGRQFNLQFNAPKSTFPQGPTQEIRNYIKTHIREHLTIETVARQMHMSASQFTRCIRRESGKTFVELLTECRLEEAKILLQETDWSTATIACLVGFKSPTYFNALFRRHLGCSPGAFRGQAQNKEQD